MVLLTANAMSERKRRLDNEWISFIFYSDCQLRGIYSGAICGIGGGVIIKPTLDAFGVLSVSTISFLSGCTVLAMTCYSVIKER